MSGRRRKHLSPSLFPFLAVLVCTLGTLILLLALVAENSKESAEQAAIEEADAARKKAIPPPVDTGKLTEVNAAELLEEEQFRVEQLVAFREQQTANVEDRRDKLAHLEDHVSRLRDDLKRLSDEVKFVAGPDTTNVIDRSAIELVKKQIEQEIATVKQLQSTTNDATPRIVIVPHQGPNGTSRRPIYVECLADGVTIWPEGVKITTLQLNESRTGANPLDAALRTIRLHALQEWGDVASPYPLLVVRPEGIDAYHAASFAIQDWDDQYGYELISSEAKLSFNTPDAALKSRVEKAVRDAMIRQHGRHQLAARGGGSGRRLPTLSAAELDRQGSATGVRVHRDQFDLPNGSITGSRFPSGQSSTQGFGPHQEYGGQGNQSSAYRQMDRHLRSAANEIAGSEQGGQDTGDSETGELTPPEQQGTKNPSGDTQSLSAAHDVGQGTDGSQMQAQSADANSGASPTNGAPPPQMAGQPAASPDATSRSQPSPEMVQRQGRDWALPDSVAKSHGNKIIRTIQVVCYPDQFLLLPSRTGGATELFGFSDGRVDRATLELATAIRDRVKNWGAALPGGRWQPRLEVQVKAQGEARFHQLRTLMNGSGVEVVRRRGNE